MSVSRRLLLALIAALLVVTFPVWWAGGLRPESPAAPGQRLPEHTSPAPVVEPTNPAATVLPPDAVAGGEDGALSTPPDGSGAPAANTAPAEDDALAATVSELPPELALLLGTIMKEVAAGNYDHAALIALDAEERSRDYPGVQLLLHHSIARNYEYLGYLDMAAEQYRKALAIDPEHAASHRALRRLDPAFEEAREEPAIPAGNPTAPPTR